MSRVARIQIVDYRLGNLFSIQQACRHAGLDAFVSASAQSLQDADGIILPGVGAFGSAMANLKELRLIEPLIEAVKGGKPLLGICLGMQLLFDSSEEFGSHLGLGLLSGNVRRLPDQSEESRKLKVPNVGWNRVVFPEHRIIEKNLWGLRNGAFMYFVHSYHVVPNETSDNLAFTRFGQLHYCSAVQRKNILGVQFHPERSALEGINFYRHWAGWIQHSC